MNSTYCRKCRPLYATLFYNIEKMEISQNRPYKFYHVIMDSALMIALIAVVYGIYLLFRPGWGSTFSLCIPALFLLKEFYDKADALRLQKISFDEENKEIKIIFHSLITGTERKSIPFALSNIEVTKSKSKLWFVEPIVLTLWKQDKFVFEIKSSKDKLSVSTIDTIALAAKECGIKFVSR